jgi:hypothetical protein
MVQNDHIEALRLEAVFAELPEMSLQLPGSGILDGPRRDIYPDRRPARLARGLE